MGGNYTWKDFSFPVVQVGLLGDMELELQGKSGGNTTLYNELGLYLVFLCHNYLVSMMSKRICQILIIWRFHKTWNSIQVTKRGRQLLFYSTLQFKKFIHTYYFKLNKNLKGLLLLSLSYPQKQNKPHQKSTPRKTSQGLLLARDK